MAPKATKSRKTLRKVEFEETVNFSNIINHRGGASSNAEDNTDVDMLDAAPENVAPRKREGPSMEKKAIMAREKALAEKFVVVQNKIENRLEKDAAVVVDCFYRADDKNATMDKSFDYSHLMKLSSPMPFILVKQVMLHEGPYAGHAAIIFKQSEPFPFMKLPVSVRKLILIELLEHHSDEIHMRMTQSGKKTVYSPDYMSKNKLSIFSVCKELRALAAPIVYGQKFQFPGTQVVTAFLVQIGQNRKHLLSISSDTYNGSSARNMFPLLQEARKFESLSFAHVSSNEGPKTAIKNIFNDAHVWLLGLDQNRPAKGLNILHFSPSAFHRRERHDDGTVDVIQWDKGEMEEFLEGLRYKLEGRRRRR